MSEGDEGGGASEIPRAEKRRGLKPGQRPANRPAGWGGQAKGAGNGKGKQNFKGAGPGAGNFAIDGEARAEREARHAQEMREFYYDVAHNPEEPTPNRISAATHLLSRIEGLPVQKVVSANVDPLSRMSEAELAAELERQRMKVASFEAAKELPALPPGEPKGDET